MRLFATLLLIELALISAVPPAAAETSITVINLHHRPAEEMIPLLQPLAGKDGTITGRGMQLIVRATPATLADIEAVLAELDRAPRRLLVTVQQLSASAAQLEDWDAGGQIRADSETEPRAQASVRVYGTSDRDEGTLVQQIQVVEGHEAYIAVGSDIPLEEREAVATFGGVMSRESTEYRAVRSGFIVLPRVSGETVTVSVQPQRQQERRESSGRIRVQEAATTVSGKLGAWMEMGGTSHELQREGRAVLGSTERAEQRQHRIRLKVDLLD